MISGLTVIGVDPGRTTGIAALHFWTTSRALASRIQLIQCDPASVGQIVRMLLDTAWPTKALAVERFVVGTRAARSQDAKASEIARDLIGEVQAIGDVVVHTRTAAEVKPWATDNRLNRLGLGLSPNGMPHARDAARHALFAAVKDGGLPDPLSRKAERL